MSVLDPSLFPEGDRIRAVPIEGVLHPQGYITQLDSLPDLPLAETTWGGAMLVLLGVWMYYIHKVRKS